VSDVSQAQRTLAEVGRLRTAGRRRRASLWYPLSLFAVAFLGGALAAVTIHRNHLGPYFAIALATIVMLSWRHYRRRDDVDGLVIRRRLLVTATATTLVAGATVSHLGFEHGSDLIDTIGPSLVIAALVLVLALALRSPLLAAVGISFVLATLLSVPLATGDDRVALTELAYALILVAAACVQHRQEQRP
jgi:hypothetical protein